MHERSCFWKPFGSERVNYFCKTLLRCLSGFWIRLWVCLAIDFRLFNCMDKDKKLYTILCLLENLFICWHKNKFNLQRNVCTYSNCSLWYLSTSLSPEETTYIAYNLFIYEWLTDMSIFVREHIDESVGAPSFKDFQNSRRSYRF